MSMAAFIKELEKGLKHPAYFLYARDEFFLKEALSAVKQTIPEADKDFLYSSFDAQAPDRPLEQLLDILYSVPFFSAGGSRQVVAVENTQKLTEKETAILEKYLQKPSPDSILIMLYVTDDRGKIKAGHKEKLSSARAIPLDMRESELPRWIKDKAHGMGVSLTDGAVEYLLGALGPEFGLLSAEVEKLCHAGKRSLDRADVQELVKGSGSFDAWNLTDALRAKDADRVFRIYASIRDEVAPETLLGAINYQYQTRPLPDLRRMARVFEILNDSDLRLKSSYYLMEDMLFKLLRA